MALSENTKSANVIAALHANSDTFLAALEAARAERTQLATEIADLQAKHAEAKRLFEEMQHTTNLEFITRCIDAGIDKHTIEELRAKCAAALAKKE